MACFLGGLFFLLLLLMKRIQLSRTILFLMLGSITWLFPSCQSQEDASMESVKTIENNQVKIAYTDSERGDTTLLFVHGSFLTKECWQSQVDYFSPRYRVVTLDLAGHGQSGSNRNDWTIQGFAEDVQAVIKKLGLKNVVLIGHSLGADVMLEVATQHPVPIVGVVAVDYFKQAGTELPKELQKQVIDNLKKEFPSTSENYARTGLLTPQTDSVLTKKIVKAYRTANPIMGTQSIMALFGYPERERELLGQLKWKLYLLNVEYVPTNEELLQKYTRAGYEVVTLKGTCHFPMLEHPQELNEAFDEVIR